MTTATTPPSRNTRTDRASLTREAILTAAERLFAEHGGVFAVSNRQVSEAAGQGNNAAVGYHFGTKTDLVRAIEHKHAVPVEKLREERVAAMAGKDAGLRDWVECLVLPLTDHLTALGNPTWYARFAAQVMADPAYQQTVTRDALTLRPDCRAGGHQSLLARPARPRAGGTQHHGGAQPVDPHLRRIRAGPRRGHALTANQLAHSRFRTRRRARRAVAGPSDTTRLGPR